MTKEQKKLVKNLADGQIPLQIAQQENLSERQIFRRIAALTDEYKAKNTTNLVAICIRKGLIK